MDDIAKFDINKLELELRSLLTDKIIGEIIQSLKKTSTEISNFNSNQNIVEVSKLKDPIILDIGGMKFSTTLATLRSEPGSYFERMFREGGYLTHEEGSLNTFFIDRDGTHFRYILNHLRGIMVDLPTDPVFRKELYHEVVYFGIESFKVRHFSFLNSVILGPYQHLTTVLSSWCEYKKTWTLAYRATRDGFSAKAFHDMVDGLSASFTFILTKNDCIIGGFTSKSWADETTEDSSCFIFSLVNSTPNSNSPKALRIGHRGFGQRGPEFGPVFGLMYRTGCTTNAIIVPDRSNERRSTCDGCFFGFTGFEVKEIEVFGPGVYNN
eukprot:gene6616-8187_t